MRLKRLRADWEHLGSADAYWAVLTEPDMRGGQWDVEKFYALGTAEIDFLMPYLAKLRPDLTHGDVLDFGCGPGRLTYALAEHFTRAVGVDVSAPMIELANERRSPEGNCEFVHNGRADLSVFADESFDLIYSHLVLQHIPTKLARGYIAEFVRLLRPDGFALFQLPERPPNRLFRVRRALQYRLHASRDYGAKVRVFGVARKVVERDVAAAGGQVVHTAADHSVSGPRDSWWYGVVRLARRHAAR